MQSKPPGEIWKCPTLELSNQASFVCVSVHEPPPSCFRKLAHDGKSLPGCAQSLAWASATAPAITPVMAGMVASGHIGEIALPASGDHTTCAGRWHRGHCFYCYLQVRAFNYTFPFQFQGKWGQAWETHTSFRLLIVDTGNKKMKKNISWTSHLLALSSLSNAHSKHAVTE